MTTTTTVRQHTDSQLSILPMERYIFLFFGPAHRRDLIAGVCLYFVADFTFHVYVYLCEAQLTDFGYIYHLQFVCSKQAYQIDVSLLNLLESQLDVAVFAYTHTHPFATDGN